MYEKQEKKEQANRFNSFVTRNKIILATLGGAAMALTLIRLFGNDQSKKFVNQMLESLGKSSEKQETPLLEGSSVYVTAPADNGDYQ